MIRKYTVSFSNGLHELMETKFEVNKAVQDIEALLPRILFCCQAIASFQTINFCVDEVWMRGILRELLRQEIGTAFPQAHRMTAFLDYRGHAHYVGAFTMCVVLFGSGRNKKAFVVLNLLFNEHGKYQSCRGL